LKNHKSTVSGKYIIFVGFISFLIAALFFLLSNFFTHALHSLILSFIFLLLIIFFGIAADLVGTAVMAANEKPFHAKASKRLKGARESILLIRNADRVANICNDVVGDITGTVSGALGIALVLQIIKMWEELNLSALNMLFTALIAALTVSGKAFAKKMALTHPNDVISFAGRFMAAFNAIIAIRSAKK